MEFGDGWLPRAAKGFDPRGAINGLHRAASATGRDPDSLLITVFGTPADIATLSAYHEAHIHRALLEVPDLSRDDVLRVLDEHARLQRHSKGIDAREAVRLEGRLETKVQRLELALDVSVGSITRTVGLYGFPYAAESLAPRKPRNPMHRDCCRRQSTWDNNPTQIILLHSDT